MKTSFMLIITSLLLCFAMQSIQAGKRRRGPDKHYRESGGWISSPNYPNLYKKSFTQNYFIKAPDNHKIVLVFHDFILKGSNKRGRTDVLRVIDGKRTSPVSTKYFEGRIGPFKYISSTNRLLLIFRSSDKYPKRGFNATFHFINKATHCKFTPLNTNLGQVTSCQNQVDDFATQCKVQCDRDLFDHDSFCVNGEFTEVDCSEYCEVSLLQVENGSVSSCKESNGSIGRASQCEVSCDEHFTGGGRAVCKDQDFVVNECIAKADLVERCESSNMGECPYTMGDIMKYHKHQQLKVNKTTEVDNETSGETPSGSNSTNQHSTAVVDKETNSVACLWQFCDRTFLNGARVYTMKCGNDPFRGLWCFYCRHVTNCDRPVPASVFG